MAKDIGGHAGSDVRALSVKCGNPRNDFKVRASIWKIQNDLKEEKKAHVALSLSLFLSPSFAVMTPPSYLWTF